MLGTTGRTNFRNHRRGGWWAFREGSCIIMPKIALTAMGILLWIATSTHINLDAVSGPAGSECSKLFQGFRFRAGSPRSFQCSCQVLLVY